MEGVVEGVDDLAGQLLALASIFERYKSFA